MNSLAQFYTSLQAGNPSPSNVIETNLREYQTAVHAQFDKESQAMKDLVQSTRQVTCQALKEINQARQYWSVLADKAKEIEHVSLVVNQAAQQERGGLL